jgi:hypothetical protein
MVPISGLDEKRVFVVRIFAVLLRPSGHMGIENSFPVYQT